MLEGFNHLISISFYDNQIKYISPNAFKDLVSLTIAHFSTNELSTFNEKSKIDLISPFHHCKRLKELNLSNNNVISIFKDWIDSKSSITKLILRNNSLTYLQVKTYLLFIL